MSRLLGGMDARMPFFQQSLLEASWYLRARRVDFSQLTRQECQFGARNKYVTLWPRSGFMSGDLSAGYCPFGQDAAQSDQWGPWERASRGNGSTKFLMGRCKDESGNGISGATVQGFLTSGDVFVGETNADSLGNYELATPYPATAHYLVAYKAGSPDICGTTVNTLQPTNRDGT